MLNETDDHGLIQSFLGALQVKNLDECRELLESLETLIPEQPTLGPWCSYLKGILVFEAEHDWAEAERMFSKLLHTELEPVLRGRVLYALGRSLDVQGRWEEAIAAFERSLFISVELGQSAEKAKAWKHIAISYRKGFTQGDFGPEALQRATEYYQLALSELEPIIDPPPDIAWLKGSVWNGLGLAYRDIGKWEEAITCYQEDLAICHLLDDRFGIGLSCGNLGEIYQKLGRAHWPEALRYYQRALAIIREFDDRCEEIEALANLAFLHQEMGEHKVALDYYSQAIQLTESLRAGISSEAARAGFFATTADIYANTVLLCLALDRKMEAYDYVERARARAFLDVLVAGSPGLSRKMEATPMTSVEVQAALPADALLIEYFTTGLEEVRLDQAASQQGLQRHRFPQAKTLIFAITRQGIHVHDAGLDPNSLRPSQLDSAVERHFLGATIRRTLYERLIAPVDDLLRGRRRLYLVPHGPLHYIPFQALTAANGDTLLREAGPQLVYAPSASLLFGQRQVEPSHAPATCLALGYNGEGDQALRFAEDEARSVARLTGGRALVGPSPKKADLYSQAPGYHLLHFSCHGDFDPESPLDSALRLAPGEVLTALDVMTYLQLHCDLVTLSACETGLSRVRRGDELVGFLRAFMVAGAPALISTLWRVDERSTSILMKRFYKELQKGVGCAGALKQAQLYLRDLNRAEARRVLKHNPADKLFDSVTPHNESPPDLSAEKATVQQASVYLKGLGTKSEGMGVEGSLENEDKEKIFADPYFWAPFILVGDHRVALLEEG